VRVCVARAPALVMRSEPAREELVRKGGVRANRLFSHVYHTIQQNVAMLLTMRRGR